MFDLTLTFDNGPEPKATPMVLDVLARRGVRSTFFVIGRKLAEPGRRELCVRAQSEGHWLGNHTWTHSGPLGTREAAGLAAREIGRTQQELGELAHARRFFRPQGGGGRLGRHLLSDDTLQYLQSERYTCILWNSIPRDWNDVDGWIERALASCGERPWTLMVLHDLPSGAMRHLDRFIGAAIDAGARLRQDFPPDCVLLEEGIVTRPVDQYVARKE